MKERKRERKSDGKKTSLSSLIVFFLLLSVMFFFHMFLLKKVICTNMLLCFGIATRLHIPNNAPATLNHIQYKSSLLVSFNSVAIYRQNTQRRSALLIGLNHCLNICVSSMKYDLWISWFFFLLFKYFGIARRILGRILGSQSVQNLKFIRLQMMNNNKTCTWAKLEKFGFPSWLIESTAWLQKMYLSKNVCACALYSLQS